MARTAGVSGVPTSRQLASVEGAPTTADLHVGGWTTARRCSDVAAGRSTGRGRRGRRHGAAAAPADQHGGGCGGPGAKPAVRGRRGGGGGSGRVAVAVAGGLRGRRFVVVGLAGGGAAEPAFHERHQRTTQHDSTTDHLTTSSSLHTQHQVFS